MQQILLSLALSFIKWYIGSGVFARIEQLVMTMIGSELTNDEKRQYVITTVKAEYSTIRTRAIDMVIGAVLTNLSKLAA